MKALTVRQQKTLLRQRLRGKISRLNARTRKLKSGKIFKRLLSFPVFVKAKTIFAYTALPREVQTRQVILKSLALGKKVYLPKVDIATRKIKFIQIRRWSDLRKGPYGILQPKGKTAASVRPDLVLVPGVGFDRKGNRLGQGLGYYDRFLAGLKKVPTAGLAFREQMAKKIPCEPHDIKLKKVLTD